MAVQLLPSHVWNNDEVGFDLSGSWELFFKYSGGLTSQGSDAAKLGITHLYSDYPSSSCGQADSDLQIL